MSTSTNVQEFSSLRLVNSQLNGSVYAETKNQWARDDPAILVLIGACLTGASAFILLMLNNEKLIECPDSCCDRLVTRLLILIL